MLRAGGLAGTATGYSLPNENQSFVELTVDPQSNLPALSFLGEDMQTVFSVNPCPPNSSVGFEFGSGLVFSDRIIFHVDPGSPPYHNFWNYTVSNSAGGPRVDGVLGTAQGQCADVPTMFSHSNVVAVLIPAATIRVSEVEVCWATTSNRTYQVQYRSALTTNAWTNLGSPKPGDGLTNCVTDKVLLGQARRFYRVLTLP